MPTSASGTSASYFPPFHRCTAVRAIGQVTGWMDRREEGGTRRDEENRGKKASIVTLIQKTGVLLFFPLKKNGPPPMWRRPRVSRLMIVKMCAVYEMAANILSTIGNTTFLNTTFCYDVQNALLSTASTGRDAVAQHSESSDIAIALSILALSTPLLFFGRYLSKFVAVGASFAIVFYFVIYVLHSNNDISCGVRMIASLVASLIVSLFVLSAMNIALLALGAAAFAMVAHFVLVSLPHDVPRVETNSTPYYLLLLGASVVGGVSVRCKEKLFLELSTAVLGGIGVVYSVDGILDHLRVDIPDEVHVAEFIALVVIGSMFQRYRRLRANRQPRARPQAQVCSS